MRLLLDENIPGETWDVLRAQGHDVIQVPIRTPDTTIAVLAERKRAVLLTRDRDFLTFLPSKRVGIIVIRIHPPIAETITHAVSALLAAKPTRWLRGKVLILRRDGFELVR